jgi:hypothetical protein
MPFSTEGQPKLERTPRVNASAKPTTTLARSTAVASLAVGVLLVEAGGAQASGTVTTVERCRLTLGPLQSDGCPTGSAPQGATCTITTTPQAGWSRPGAGPRTWWRRGQHERRHLGHDPAAGTAPRGPGLRHHAWPSVRDELDPVLPRAGHQPRPHHRPVGRGVRRPVPRLGLTDPLTPSRVVTNDASRTSAVTKASLGLDPAGRGAAHQWKVGVCGLANSTISPGVGPNEVSSRLVDGVQVLAGCMSARAARLASPGPTT